MTAAASPACGEEMVAAGLAGFMTVKNGAGEKVRQKGRWLPDELMSGLHADVVRQNGYGDDRSILRKRLAAREA